MGFVLSPLILTLAGMIAFLLGVFPIAHHLAFGLPERRREILGYFDASSIKLYFNQFYHAESQLLNPNPTSSLSLMYDERFGRRTFWLPLAVFIPALALTITVILLLAPGNNDGGNGYFSNFGEMSIYALAGAYLYVVSNLMARQRQRDLVPSVIYWSTFRLVIALPLAAAVTFIVKDAAAAPIAFLLGVFPTDTLLLILRRQVAPRFGITDDPTQSAPGSWQGIGGESPPRGRSSQPPRPRVMHEVLLARAAVKRSQGRPWAKYRAAKRV
jgi:hypothetical protein